MRQASLMKVNLGILAVGHVYCRILLFCTAVKDWLQNAAPHLVLAGFIEAMKTALSSGRPVVALDCKRCSSQYLSHGWYANWRHATHLCAGYGHKWDVAPQV